MGLKNIIGGSQLLSLTKYKGVWVWSVGVGMCNDPPLISNYILKCCAELTMTNVHDHACIAGMNDESRNHLILIVFTHHYYEVKSPGVWWSPSLQQPGRRALGNPLRWPPRK